MASLPIAFSPAAGRVFAATAAKGAGESKKEKGLLDWIIGSLNKDQLLETDPVLQKVEGKDGTSGNGTGTVRGRKNSVQIPPKKNGGVFGGLFAKKD
ncbi:uncharacterized protein E5676_scaffold571G00530 [Cucumis melo var. makuwa]|uniref:Uncharacterized protein LOC103502033 n=2 Tax=Cucumis melo TaxID=3656 RepID=A0A1S3CKK5_CUCME|nr:uncharacterized protein LOC103502033 [Cucumis melo]KAA0061846.1 uncharacterized protein E6C27_scaffold89G00830 [Cucumis melo var. makuwa]TYK15410.1 uncharacterized protein E5676_scaffold571G00530 [Cucumis melo var. makuwa]